jgi:hypothetical protein
MNVKERLTLEDRMKLKRKRKRQILKRRARGESAESDGKISNWSEQIPEIEPLVRREI